MSRIGLIGPADGADPKLLRSLCEVLLIKHSVEQAIYLGDDDAAEKVSAAWADELNEGDTRDFLTQAAELAVQGNPDAIEALLERDQELARLNLLRALPPAPARAVEMVGDRIVLVVYDKKILDEEDIANAHIIVYGKAPEMLLKQFGPRYFFAPGPVAEGKVGMLEMDDEGRVSAVMLDVEGKETFREELVARKSKMMVTG